MDILRNTSIDFMKYRRLWITVSFLTIAIGVFGILFHGKLNVGVDFAGGTQITLKFRERPDIEVLRSLVGEAGFRDAQIQRFGDEAGNEAMIRTPVVGGSEEGSARQVAAALAGHFNQGQPRDTDLNQIGMAAVTQVLVSANPDNLPAADAEARYQAMAEAVLAVRKDLGLFTDWGQVGQAAGLSPAALQALQQHLHLGAFSTLSVENVGPQVGAELRKRGILAVVGAMIGMLLYIWVRFELRFGVGSTMAVLHDVLITLGLFYWAGYEFNLTTVAAFLTLIGYSVNDTVVTFDRVRENMRKRRGGDMIELFNKSINQTLSRTILTGGTTIAASLMLYLFGGDVIRGFAFVMTIGVVVGTYSSIYIASPFALLWENWFGPQGRLRQGKAGAQPAAAGKSR